MSKPIAEVRARVLNPYETALETVLTPEGERQKAFVQAFWNLHRSYAAMGMARTCVPTIEGMPQHFCPLVPLVTRLAL